MYKHFEPDATKLPLHAFCLALVPAIPASLILNSFSGNPFSGFVTSFAVFYVSLLSSIVSYRLSPWHPLSRYPGPLIARISMMWTAYKIMEGKVHVYRKELHDKYGPYVRVGEFGHCAKDQEEEC